MARVTIRRNALRTMLLNGHYDASLNGEWLPCYHDSDPRVIDGAVLVSDLDLTAKARCAGAWAEDDGTISLVVSDTRSFTLRKRPRKQVPLVRFTYAYVPVDDSMQAPDCEGTTVDDISEDRAAVIAMQNMERLYGSRASAFKLVLVDAAERFTISVAA